MTTRYITIALAATFALVACNHLPSEAKKVAESPPPAMEKTNDAMVADTGDDAMMDDEMMEEKSDSMQEKSGEYVAYQDGVIGNEEESVLFFHASWCPVCKGADTFLKAQYEQENPTLTTYKLDYDTNLELRKKYGIVTQHTFVRIDSSGNAIETLSGPTNSRLSQLIGS